MLIVKIKAGLGNQLFQYAFGRTLSIKRNESLFLDISGFDNQSEKDTKRDFTLNKFNIKATIVDQTLAKKYNSKPRIFLRKLFDRIKKIGAYTYYPSLLKSRRTYYEGYWINQKYFANYRNEIVADLKLKESFGTAAEKISLEIISCIPNNQTPVSLNIRRGDFVTNPHAAFNGVLGINYYQKAFTFLEKERGQKNIHLFVFSDDIAWAKENLTLPCPMHFVSNPDIKDYEELILISKCKHNIIANSTFSWWGAWLNQNPDKIVIAPYQWLKDKTAEDLDVLPPEWVKI